MFIDAQTASPSQLDALSADVCIVGAGPAGITLALALSGRGRRILLLESGGLAHDERTQALYAGEIADEKLHSPPDKYRQRRFGGSSTIWGGRCMPFDPIDFEPRDYVPASGWPFGYDTVAPYYPRANELVEAGVFDYDARTALPGRPPMIEGFSSERVQSTGLERFSCPTDFGGRYAGRLRAAADVTVLLNANCTRLAIEAGEVRRIECATLDGRRFAVAARHCVLACGGLETPRLLLASDAPNPHDVTGRYYMCHIAGSVGALTLHGDAARVHHGYQISDDGVYCRRRLALAPAEQRRLGAGNVVARLHFARISDPAHRNGVLSMLYLAKGLISYEYGKRLNDGEVVTGAMRMQHVRNVIVDGPTTAGFLWHWLRDRKLAARKFPSIILKNRGNRFSLDVHGEQEPNPASRVTLGSGRDALGVPQIRVDWRYTPGDIASIRKTLDVFAEEFRRTGVGEFSYQPERLEHELTKFGAYGGHHIGTARMGRDPASSVVDPDGRHHQVDNLYVCGAAAFPTSSQANPTLTIVALALRMADHLDTRLA